MTKVG